MSAGNCTGGAAPARLAVAERQLDRRRERRLQQVSAGGLDRRRVKVFERGGDRLDQQRRIVRPLERRRRDGGAPCRCRRRSRARARAPLPKRTATAAPASAGALPSARASQAAITCSHNCARQPVAARRAGDLERRRSAARNAGRKAPAVAPWRTARRSLGSWARAPAPRRGAAAVPESSLSASAKKSRSPPSSARISTATVSVPAARMRRASSASLVDGGVAGDRRRRLLARVAGDALRRVRRTASRSAPRIRPAPAPSRRRVRCAAPAGRSERDAKASRDLADRRRTARTAATARSA